MNKYFIIPISIFFLIICVFVFYLQFINENWKFVAPKKNLPDVCNDKNKLELITHSTDYISDRSFKDNPDQFFSYQFHAIYFLPCEQEDRRFDTNLNVQSSLISINKWFAHKTKNQKINFDMRFVNKIDITFLRANKTTNWFAKNKNHDDVASIIENIIFSNSSIFNNFNKKKFIVFFEGWERRKSFFYDICGQSKLNGKVAIFFANSRWKKNVGDNKKMFSCLRDSLNDLNDYTFGESEGTILHEILHTLGAPAKCAKNLDPDSTSHVNDSKKDILYKISGETYLDYNNDDYYKHNIEGCLDIADSKYLTNF